jgi:hypothetical protein
MLRYIKEMMERQSCSTRAKGETMRRLVLHFRNSHHFAAAWLRASETKEHRQISDLSAVLKSKLL